MIEEISQKTNLTNFIKSDIENKINFCLTETNEAENKKFRDLWKKNTEKNGINQYESIMIWTDLLKDHRITHNKAEIKTICPACREIATIIEKIDLSVVKFSIEENTSIKKLQNIAPNHVNLTCKCGNNKFPDKTIFKWIQLPQLIIIQTDLNKDPKRHENTRMLNSDTNIFNPNRIPMLNQGQRIYMMEK